MTFSFIFRSVDWFDEQLSYLHPYLEIVLNFFRQDIPILIAYLYSILCTFILIFISIHLCKIKRNFNVKSTKAGDFPLDSSDNVKLNSYRFNFPPPANHTPLFPKASSLGSTVASFDDISAVCLDNSITRPRSTGLSALDLSIKESILARKASSLKLISRK